MSRIAEQVEELEHEISALRDEVDKYMDRCEAKNDEIAELEDELNTLYKYIEWFEATYPEARTAYKVAQRVST